MNANSTPAFAIGGLPGLAGDFVVMPRPLAERCRELAERVLAFSGDSPDTDLIQLQHDLADLLRPPASTQPERPNQPT